jgi:hypothetical protein
MSSPKKDPAEGALTLILDALAAALIQLEVTPSRLSQLARTSFVKAGASQARMRSSGRPHLAKIAALTGLTRTEVKRIVSAGYRTASLSSDESPRALRVLHGWRTSPEYSSGGKPRALPISGRTRSFDSLCKTFSGDIPKKVILDELERQQRVVLTRDRQWISISKKSKVDPRVHRMQSTLGFVAALLSESLNHEGVVLKRREKISTTSELTDKYVEGAVTGRLAELFDQMPRLYAAKGKPARHLLNAYTLVTRAPASAARRRGR